MYYKYVANFLRCVLLVGGILGGALQASAQERQIFKGAASAFSKEMAVAPAVGQALKRNFSSLAGTDLLAPVTQTSLTRAVEKHLPLPVDNILLAAHLEKSPYTFPAQWINSVFLARPLGKIEGRNTFSGTIVKTRYNGQEEIYGVIAAHSIAERIGDPSLEQLFTADIYVNDQFVPVQSQIVQISAPGGLDLALVKFPKWVEPYLQPFEFSTEEPRLHDELQTLGFSRHFVIHLPHRILFSKNRLYLRSDMELDPYQRRGMCGAPLFTPTGSLVGIHTGTVVGGLHEPNYVGYAVRAGFINTLVEAYHNGGKATVPFELNGQKIVDLEINEFVSYVELTDTHGEVLWEREVRSKFPYREVERNIQELQPRYVGLVSSITHLEEGILSSRTKNKFGAVNYVYDLRKGTLQIITKE